MKHEIKLNYSDIQEALNKLLQRTNDLTPVMRGIAAIMESAAEGAFANEADPTTGKAWEPLSEETTIPFRIESGHWPGQILQVKGGLAASIETTYGSDYAIIGSALVYARIQHEGGRTSPRSMIFDEEIPARPYLGLSEHDRQDAVNIIRNFLKNGQTYNN